MKEKPATSVLIGPSSSSSDPASTSSPRVARWSAAALAGLSLMGCPDKSGSTSDKEQAEQSESAAVSGEKTEKKCCMGINECKGKGGCAVPESHSCAGKNECKGQGGCNMHCPK